MVDLFAGPGGLSEGFSRYSEFTGDIVSFNVALSIEKNPVAHRTLRLRSFFRQFESGQAPQVYYNYIRATPGPDQEYWFEKLMSYPEWVASEKEAKLAELGSDDATLFDVIGWVNGAVGNVPHWVLLGGPPCQAYSIIGRSRRVGLGRRATRQDADEVRQQLHEDFMGLKMHTLYKEYLGVLAILQPSVFVMENVKGVLTSKIKVTKDHPPERIFEHILRDLKDPWSALAFSMGSSINTLEAIAPRNPRGYRILPFVRPEMSDLTGEHRDTDFVIQCERHGIPQERHRVILLGIRNDLNVDPKLVESNSEQEICSIGSVIDELPKLRSGRSGRIDHKTLAANKADTPAAWIEVIREGFGDELLESIEQSAVREVIRRVRDRQRTNLQRGGQFVPSKSGFEASSSDLMRWIRDPRIGGYVQHESRTHMDMDIVRYLFVSAFGKVMRLSPKLRDFPIGLLPDHRNVRDENGDRASSDIFDDRFRVQIKERPASTITSHIRKDGHYFIHYDPRQSRSLTVREAARIQTFPDNYYFAGNRTEQYEQVGNAVPPFLAVKLAMVVAGVIRDALRNTDTQYAAAD